MTTVDVAPDPWALPAVLPVEAAVYSQGTLVGGGYINTLRTEPSYDQYWDLPDAKRYGPWGYRLRLRSRGLAGVAGWLALEMDLAGPDGALVAAPAVPALLWVRPWAVPSVTPLPARGDYPVHVVTLRVSSGEWKVLGSER